MQTLEKYTQAHFKSAPTGMLIPTYPDDSNLKRLFEVGGNALLQAETSADKMADEIFPDNAGAYLGDWERVLGLPLKGLEGLPTQQRLGMVKAWMNIGEYSNAAFFVSLAALAGYTITITEFEPFRVGVSAAGESLSYGDKTYYYWQVNAPAETNIDFKCGASGAGERLVEYGNTALETLIKFFSPAHTVVLFNYV